ncbi:unnamed protein product [Natator depressus]
MLTFPFSLCMLLLFSTGWFRPPSYPGLWRNSTRGEDLPPILPIFSLAAPCSCCKGVSFSTQDVTYFLEVSKFCQPSDPTGLQVCKEQYRILRLSMYGFCFCLLPKAFQKGHVTRPWLLLNSNRKYVKPSFPLVNKSLPM